MSNSRQTVPKEWKEKLGYRCYNCGCEENIEYHHIVPMFLGGNDVITNVVPLCNRCHKVAHKGRHMHRYTNKANAGRKKLCDDETVRQVADMYINGEIGNRKAVELVNGKPGSRFSSRRSYKAYIQELGIKTVRNYVDYLAENTYEGLVEGKECVLIEFLDGSYTYNPWHDTGKNDVEYTKSGKVVNCKMAKEKVSETKKTKQEELDELFELAHMIAEDLERQEQMKKAKAKQNKKQLLLYEQWKQEFKIG